MGFRGELYAGTVGPDFGVGDAAVQQGEDFGPLFDVRSMLRVRLIVTPVLPGERLIQGYGIVHEAVYNCQGGIGFGFAAVMRGIA